MFTWVLTGLTIQPMIETVSKWKPVDQRGRSNLIATLKVVAWGGTACQQAFRGQQCPLTSWMQTEQQGQDSHNGLIEKWPSKNLAGIWRIRRSVDDAMFLSTFETRPNCLRSNAAHCIQDWTWPRESFVHGSVWVSQYQKNSSGCLLRPPPLSVHILTVTEGTLTLGNPYRV